MLYLIQIAGRVRPTTDYGTHFADVCNTLELRCSVEQLFDPTVLKRVDPVLAIAPKIFCFLLVISPGRCDRPFVGYLRNATSEFWPRSRREKQVNPAQRCSGVSAGGPRNLQDAPIVYGRLAINNEAAANIGVKTRARGSRAPPICPERIAVFG